MLSWKAHRGNIESMAFSANGRFLATATGGTRRVYIWDPTTGGLITQLTGNWPTGYGLGMVKSVAFAPETQLLAAATLRSVTVWQAGTWELLADLDLDHAHEIAFGPGEAPLLAASNSAQVGIWKEPGRPTEVARAPDRLLPTGGGVACLDFSPDGTLLAASTIFRINLRRVADGGHIRTYRIRDFGEGDTANRGVVRFSPDGTRLAMAYGKWVEVHPIEKKATRTIKIEAGTGQPPTVWAVNWTPDSRALLTVGSDGFARLWDAASGAELRSFDWRMGKLYCAAFSPDGLTCAAGGEKGQVVVWDVDA